MTWSAFLGALRNGIQTRANAVRQGANRAAQQRPGANQARAASNKVNEQTGNDATKFDFLVMEEVSLNKGREQGFLWIP